MREPDSRTDEQLVAAAAARDAAAFEALYHRHRDWVVALAMRFTQRHDLALDVLQETFLYVLSCLPRLKLTAKFTTFLYPAVKNLSIAALKKARRYKSDEDAMADLAAPPPAAGAGRDELAEAMTALSPELREVVLMRFVDGMILEEIGVALQIPLGTVKSRLHNALEQLRRDDRARRLLEG